MAQIPCRTLLTVSPEGRGDETGAVSVWGRCGGTRVVVLAGALRVSRSLVDRPQYSHGFLIPIIALGLLWLRDVPREVTPFQPSWLGLPLLATALGMRLWGGWFYFDWLEWISLIPAVAGVCVMTLGTKAFRFAWPSIGFLVFMIPLPYRLEVSLLQPLQNFATQCATFVLQTLGLAASSQGNVVWIGETAVGVAQACSGLRMLTVFVALATALALIVERGGFDRTMILASAIPIAIVCNVIRVTVTAIVFTSVFDEGFRTSFATENAQHQ
jgi:exosortase